MMSLDEISSRMEILEVLYTYCRGVDRGDADLIRSAYHPDAFDDHGSFKGLGHDFAPHIVRQMDHNGAIGQHHVTNTLIEFVDADTARAESYCIALNPEPGGSTAVVWNRYYDRFERRDGIWKIARRQVIIDNAPHEADGSPWARLHLFSQGARRDADPTHEFLGSTEGAGMA